MLSCLGVLLGVKWLFTATGDIFYVSHRTKGFTSSATKHCKRHFEKEIFKVQEEFFKHIYRRQPKKFESSDH